MNNLFFNHRISQQRDWRHSDLPGSGGFRVQGLPGGVQAFHRRRHAATGQDIPHQRLLHIYPGAEANTV